MKRLRIYERTITVRTGYKKYPFKSKTQYIVCYGTDIVLKNDHSEDYRNPHLRIPFALPIETRSKERVRNFVSKLGRSEDNKWLKNVLNKILEEENNHE